MTTRKRTLHPIRRARAGKRHRLARTRGTARNCIIPFAILAGVALAPIVPARAQEPPQHVHTFVAAPQFAGSVGTPSPERYHALPGEVLALSYMSQYDVDTCTNQDGMCPQGWFPFFWDPGYTTSLDDSRAAPNKGQYGEMVNGQFVPGGNQMWYKCPPTLGDVTLIWKVIDEGVAWDDWLQQLVATVVDGEITNTSYPIMVWSIISPTMSDDEKHCMSDTVPSTSDNIPVATNNVPVYWAAWLGAQFSGQWNAQTDPVYTKTLTVTTANNRPGDPLNGRLPDSNSSFGPQSVSAIHHTLEGSTCNRRFLLFFPRTGTNCPTNVAFPVPNWYYYWSQTSASYGPHVYNPNSPDPYGYTPIQGTDTWIGPLAHTTHLDYPGYEGIDLYALTCRHEAVHLADWAAWWPGGYTANLDADGDQVPDALEAALGYDRTKRDTDGDGKDDFEDHARDHALDTNPPWPAQHGWTIGQANSEDWACPGKQWTNP